jgi:Nuclease-related domain
MLPSQPDADTPQSEQKVFAAFARHLPADWTVFHSRRIVLPRSSVSLRAPRGSVKGHESGLPVDERELDFVVIDPRRGMLGLEVKGGMEIGRDADGWYSGGGPRHRIKAPGAQVQRAMHALEEYLRPRAAVPAFGWGVVFPMPKRRTTSAQSFRGG